MQFPFQQDSLLTQPMGPNTKISSIPITIDNTPIPTTLPFDPILNSSPQISSDTHSSPIELIHESFSPTSAHGTSSPTHFISSPPIPLRCSSRLRKPPSYLGDYHCNLTLLCHFNPPQRAYIP